VVSFQLSVISSQRLVLSAPVAPQGCTVVFILQARLVAPWEASPDFCLEFNSLL